MPSIGLTKQDLGTLRQFVVTADVAANATTIPIFPWEWVLLLVVLTYSNQSVMLHLLMVQLLQWHLRAVRFIVSLLPMLKRQLRWLPLILLCPQKQLKRLPVPSMMDCIAYLTDYFPDSDQLGTRVDVLFRPDLYPPPMGRDNCRQGVMQPKVC